MDAPTCGECGEPFAHRGELLVLSVGRGSFACVHPQCRAAFAARLPRWLRGMGAVNRPTVLLWLLALNLLFAAWWALAPAPDRRGVVLVWLLSDLFLLMHRALAWWCFERHLPHPRRGPPSHSSRRSP